MKPNLLSAPSTFFRLTGLRCTSLRWSLLRLNLSLRIFRSLRRRATASIRFAAIIVEKLEGGEAAIKRQHHLAPFDLTDLPSVDVVADLRTQQFSAGARANDRARALAVHHDAEQNQVWRRRRGRWRRLRDRRRRRWRRGRTAARRKQRPIKRRRELVERLRRYRIGRRSRRLVFHRLILHRLILHRPV